MSRLSVQVVTFGQGSSSGSANPTDYFKLGALRLGYQGSYYETQYLDGAQIALDVPAGANQLGYSLFAGTVITVTEQFLSTAPGGVHVAGLNYGATVTQAMGRTQIQNYTVPTGRSALIEAIYIGMGLSTASITATLEVYLVGQMLYYNILNGPLASPYQTGLYPVLLGNGGIKMNAGEQIASYVTVNTSGASMGVWSGGMLLEYPQPMW